MSMKEHSEQQTLPVTPLTSAATGNKTHMISVSCQHLMKHKTNPQRKVMIQAQAKLTLLPIPTSYFVTSLANEESSFSQTKIKSGEYTSTEHFHVILQSIYHIAILC